MLLDSTLLFFDAIGDDEGADTVVGVVSFKDAPDNDNDADTDEDEDDQKVDDDDWDSNEAAATDVSMVVIDEEGNGDDATGVDCASVPVRELKYD